MFSRALSPRWLPDGQRVAFIRRRRDESRELRILDTKTGQSKLVVIRPIWEIEVSPDGRRVVWRTQAPEGSPGIEVLDLEARTIDRLADGAASDGPLWSADGRWIAWAGSEAVEVIDLESRKVRRLIQAPASRMPLAWSPSGARLAVVANNEIVGEPGSGRLVVADPASASTVVRAELPVRLSLHAPAWSPDGKRIAFVVREGTGSEGRILTVDVAGGDPQPLCPGPAWDDFRAKALVWRAAR